MKKGLFALVALIVVVFAAALTLPQMIDWNEHKPKIQSAIAEATGYEVTFGGTVKLAVLPFPHVVVENLSVRVPGAGDDLLRLKKAEVNVALGPLFRGEVSVSSVSLIDPVLMVKIAADGTPSWQTPKIAALQKAGEAAEVSAPASSGAADRFAINRITIENGTIRYSDARKGSDLMIERINSTLSADTLAGPFRARGDVQWSGQRVDFDVNLGRIDQAAKSMSANIALRLPQSGGAMLDFAGLVGTGGGLDVQGETKIQGNNVSALLTGLSGKPSTLPPLPLRVEGVVTARDDMADVRNLSLTLGDLKASGAVSLKNLSATDGAAQIEAKLASDSVIDIEKFMPGKSVRTVRAAADSSAPKVGGLAGFLPESLTLPQPVDGTVALKLAGLTYKGAEFGGITATLEKKGRVITIDEAVAQMPGGGALRAKSTLNFASASKNADRGGIVYADPTLSYDLSGEAKSPSRLFAPFLPETTMKSMQPLFRDPVKLAAKGSLRPDRVGIESGNVTLGATALSLGASSYALNRNGRDVLVLSVSGRDLNLDHFTGAPATASTPQDKAQSRAPAKPAGKALQDTLKTLALPIDLTLKANLENVTMQGTSYAAMVVDGSLKGSVLDIASASLRDGDGDTIRLSGRVDDVQSLRGIDLRAVGRTADTIGLLSSFKMDVSKWPADFGAMDLDAKLTGTNADVIGFAAQVKALGGDMQADGQILNILTDKPAADQLSFRIKHPNFDRLVRVFNPAYKAGVGMKKDLDFFAGVTHKDGVYTFNGLNINLGGVPTTGDLRIDLSGPKPDIVAAFNSGTIPLDVLSGKDRTAKTTAATPGTVQRNQPTGAAGGGADVRWSRNAINTAWMHGFNLDLNLNAQSVQYGDWTLNETVLALVLKDGTLNIGRADAQVYGGTMNLNANMKAGGGERDPLSFTVKAGFKDVALEPLAASFSGARVVRARGNGSLELEASSTGISPAALVSALRGAGKVDGRDVVLQGFDLAAMSRSLVSTSKVVDNITGLANAAFKGGETAFDTIDGPFTINEGIIGFDRFLMTGPTATVTSRGQISLPRWVIDMTSTIDLVEPEDAPNLDVRFQGPLDRPGNSFAGAALESYIGSRVGEKLQDLIGDKAPELNKLLDNVLGGGRAAPAQPSPDAAPAEGASAPDQPADDSQAQQPQRQPSPEEQLMRGVLQGIMGGR